jgi:hypothetical protein
MPRSKAALVTRGHKHTSGVAEKINSKVLLKGACFPGASDDVSMAATAVQWPHDSEQGRQADVELSEAAERPNSKAVLKGI